MAVSPDSDSLPTDIAVVGLGARLPDVTTGVIADVERFEAELFGFTLVEAAVLDPQHRLLLETAWSALEDAGYDPRAVPLRTAVFVGGATTAHMLASHRDATALAEVGELNVRLLSGADFLASWISYRLGLEGPSVAVQAFGATSLAAVHLAARSLLLGECDLAIAGAAAVGAAGPGPRVDGVGVVVLRRLDDALADGSPIHAVLRNTVLDGNGNGNGAGTGDRGTVRDPVGAADLVTAVRALGALEDSVGGAAPRSGPQGMTLTAEGWGGVRASATFQAAPPASEVSQTYETDETSGRAASNMPVLIPVSARSATQASAIVRALSTAPALADPDLVPRAAHTLRVGRSAHAWRGYVVAEPDQVTEELGRLTGFREAAETGDPVLLFPGQGSQYPAMGAGLYAAFPEFRRAMDDCARLLDVDPRSWLTDPGPRAGTAYWQPAIFSVEYAVARLWRSWGVTAAAMVGHSVGEYVAACLAGVMSLRDALHLVTVRGRLMAGTAPGRMVAVRLAEPEARDLLTPGLDLAAVNGPRACVLSGTPEAVSTLIRHLDRERVDHQDLGQTRAFHSLLMEGVLEEFERQVGKVTLAAPGERVVSTVTGDWATARQLTDPRYWADQIRMPVRFGAAATTAAEAGSFFLEAGPGTALAGHVRRAALGDAVSAVSVLGGETATETTWTLRALGEWWAAGGAADWPRIFGTGGARLHLPTYPFAGAVVARSPEPTPSAADSSAVDLVVDLLCRTLGVVPPADLELSYLGAGGESLTAIHIIGRLREDFGYEAPVRLLLEPIPLRQLAERIVEECAAASDEELLAAILDDVQAEDARS